MYTDGADKAQIVEMAKNAWISGFTTNPSLPEEGRRHRLHQLCARSQVAAVPNHHISFEVISDDIPEMLEQARLISTVRQERLRQDAGDDDQGRAPLDDAVRTLSREGIKVNFHGDLHLRAGREGCGRARRRRAGHYLGCSPGVSADLGIDYRPIMPRRPFARPRDQITSRPPGLRPREVFNVIEADEMGCHIITAPADVLKKMPAIGTKTRRNSRLGAVQAFRDDALAAGITLPTAGSVRAAE